MKWTPWLLVWLTAFAISACDGGRRDNGAAETGSESGTMQGGASIDTATSPPGTTGTATDTAGMTSDTSHDGAHGDSVTRY
jgi:hypothetical protein